MKPASISEEELLNLINKLNNDDNVDGLLVQLPLPGEIFIAPFKMISEAWRGLFSLSVGSSCLFFLKKGEVNQD